MRRRRTQKGNALIEFALSATLLVSIFTGVFQFGHTMIVVENLVTAVRGGGRFAAVTDYTAGDYQTRIKNMVVYGQPTTGTDTVVPGLTTGNVEVVLTPSAGVPETVTVRITGYSVNALFRTFNFNGHPTVTFPYNGS